MNTKRILLGLAAAAVFGLVAGELISLANVTVNPVLQSIVLGFLATAIGAFIARRGFVLPALGLWLVEWLLVVYLLYFIAAPTGQASFLAIAQINLLSIVLSALAVAIGALVGQALGKRAQYSAPAI
jgi:putative Mn2+ efflux pump MntP